MNRFLVGGCLMVLFGCGARTESFTDEDGYSGQHQGGSAGAPQAVAGNADGPGISGAPNVKGGAANFGGTPGVIAGAPSFGGTTFVAGAPSFGGTPNVSGAPNAIAGSPGSGAASGIIAACQAVAGNSCQKCLCTACSSSIEQCFSNFGCALILACAQQTGCQGLACYSGRSCKSVIDRFGGPTGPAMKDVLSLALCSNASQDSCSCN